MNTENRMSSAQQCRYAVQVCQVVCSPTPELHIKNHMPGWNIVWSSLNINDPNFFIVAENVAEKIYVLAIRGSVMPVPFGKWAFLGDWVLEDLNDALAYWPYTSDGKPALISAGGYVGFTNLLLTKGTGGDTLLDFLKKKNKDLSKDFVITGYSLGGNLAKVYGSYYLHLNDADAPNKRYTYLYTFAAPSSGNTAFNDDLNKKFIGKQNHLQNTNDAVPYYPVAKGLAATAMLYAPDGPDAAVIVIPNTDPAVTIQQFYLGLSKGFERFDYQQPDPRSIMKFTNPIVAPTDSTFDNWKNQVIEQHKLDVYANEVLHPKTEHATAQAATV
ncbi:lipase (class 3) [Chitinophaga dinghuensis]|uniref:Lipase (Class 3) n=1 Tax=Chitinophaga dinghuensis TaxID=1539050 RepID=A0A327VSI0_9BACT|nr:hypothetical protein [Chitinophaga dinghuensis]RAJ77337.1 lipase (class 3) [Chitinophaga dinghuensis]